MVIYNTMLQTVKFKPGLFSVLTALSVALCGASPAVDGAVMPGALLDSARVPFVRNDGQLADGGARYYAKTFGGTVYAMDDGRIVYRLPRLDGGRQTGSAVLEENLTGGWGTPLGVGKSRTSVNSCLGNDPSNWKMGLPAFDRLDFGEVYDGINFLLSAHGNNVEKVFVVSPGADYRKIGFRYEGALSLEVTAEGQLEVRTALGPVYFSKPVAWAVGEKAETFNTQLPTSNAEKRGLNFESSTLSVERFDSALTPVAVDYALDEDGTVRFELSPYDKNKTLVIDPLLASTFIGGGGADAVQACVVDSQTNVYVAGYTDSSDFPVTNSTVGTANAGNYDVFVSKFDGNLETLSASTYLGGSSNDQAFAMGIDAGGRIWLAGYTESTNFPVSRTTPLAAYTNYGGNGDAFVAILSGGLNSLVRATYMGGSEQDSATAIAMNNSNQCQYVVGYTASADFPKRNYYRDYKGGKDAFVLLFTNDVATNTYLSGTYLGGGADDAAFGVAVVPGSTNPVCVVGYTASGNLDPIVGENFPITNACQSDFHGSNDVFVTRLGVLLTNMIGSTFLGGSDNDIAYSVAIDRSNRIYVAGSTHSDNFPRNPTDNIYYEGHTNRYCGGDDVFVTCLTNGVSNLCASTYLGGVNDDAARTLAIASDVSINYFGVTSSYNYIYMAGYTSSSNFPATRNAYGRSLSGGEDAFVLYFRSSVTTNELPLTNLYVSSFLGGGADDRALALGISADTGMVFVAGVTASSYFPSSDTTYQNYFGGGAVDGFISKFPAQLGNGTLKWKQALTNAGNIMATVRCSSPALAWNGAVFVGNNTALCAFARSGTELWTAPINSSVAEYATDREGRGTPAVGTNNIIYVNTSGGTVYAINSTGAATLVFASAAPTFWSAPALDNNGNVLFSQNAYLYALARTGNVSWTNTLASSSKTAPSVASNGLVYAVASTPVSGAVLYGINTTNGSVSKSWTVPGEMYSSPALSSNGTIYAASSNKLYAFNPDGTINWTGTVAGSIFSSPAIGTNGFIYIGGGSNLYAFNTNGAITNIWTAGGLAGEVRSSPAIAADGSVIFCSSSGFVYSCRSDGTTNWVFETDQYSLFQSPLIDSEGTIYVSDNWYVYALYGDYPPADSAWPMYRRDALRTGNQGVNIADFLRPGGVTVSKGTYTNYIRVGWNASSNAVSYELWRNTNNSSATATRIRRLAQTNYNDSAIDSGKIYYYWVKVKTPIALSSFSADDNGGVPPNPPTGVSASGGVPTNSVEVAWNASSNATDYYVYRSLVNNTGTAVQITSTTSTNYSDTAVAPGLRHYYWIKAANSEAGISAFSSPSAGGGIPCLPPAGLTASQAENYHQVDLSWNSSTGASSYLLYRDTDDNPAGAVVLTNVTGQSITDYTVTPMRRYYYWLRTTNDFGLSGFSDSAVGWCLLTAPQEAFASAGTYSNMIRVSWIVGSTDATAHVIFRSETEHVEDAVRYAEVVYNSVTATNYDDTGITRGVSYYYWLAARNNYGSSVWVAADSPGATPPGTPTDLNASDGTYSNMIMITWTAAPGTLYYTLYRSDTYDPTHAAVVGSSLTNVYEDRSANYGTIYYYWVKAFNNYGASGFSTFNSGWRGMLPPADITASDGNSTNEVTVRWSGAPGATSYEVWRGTSTNISSACRLVNNVTLESYRDVSATPGTVYYYWVKSKRGIYSSAFSGYDSGYRAIGVLDLAVSDFVFLPQVCGLLAKPSAVSFKVSNESQIDLAEPNNSVRYDFYLSRSSIFGTNEAYWFGGTNSTLTLNSGSATRVVLSKLMRQIISIPVWATSNYYVYVFINHTLPSGWQDPDLSNNSTLRLGDIVTLADSTAIQQVWSDFDGDGKTDLALFNDARGAWLAWLSASGYGTASATGIGVSGTRAVSRDYDGDGRTDPAVYHDVSGAWQVCLSASSYRTVLAVGLGGPGQTAVPADYDGDGLADPAVYQSSTGTWRLWPSDSGYVETDLIGMGGAGWTPVPADYDGDQYADPAIYSESTGTWRIWLSGSGYAETVAAGWGGAGQLPVPADYDADGKIDPAVYQSNTGTWRVWASGVSYRESKILGWGGAGQIAVPGDYDGDGKVDPAVYWESLGVWRIWASSYLYFELNMLATGGEGYHAITGGE